MTKRQRPVIPPPPDGGYGWVILISCFLTCFVCDGIAFSFGILIKPITNYFETDNATTAIAASIHNGCRTIIGGILCAVLIPKFGARKVGVSATIVMSIGLLISAFAPNIQIFAFTYGLVAGGSSGLLLLCPTISLNFWFSKRRAIANCISATGFGFGMMIVPICLQTITSSWGWRDALWLASAISTNGAVFCMLLRAIDIKKPNTDSRKTKRDRKSSPVRESGRIRVSIDESGSEIVENTTQHFKERPPSLSDDNESHSPPDPSMPASLQTHLLSMEKLTKTMTNNSTLCAIEEVDEEEEAKYENESTAYYYDDCHLKQQNLISKDNTFSSVDILISITDYDEGETSTFDINNLELDNIEISEPKTDKSGIEEETELNVKEVRNEQQFDENNLSSGGISSVVEAQQEDQLEQKLLGQLETEVPRGLRRVKSVQTKRNRRRMKSMRKEKRSDNNSETSDLGNLKPKDYGTSFARKKFKDIGRHNSFTKHSNENLRETDDASSNETSETAKSSKENAVEKESDPLEAALKRSKFAKASFRAKPTNDDDKNSLRSDSMDEMMFNKWARNSVCLGEVCRNMDLYSKAKGELILEDDVKDEINSRIKRMPSRFKKVTTIGGPQKLSSSMRTNSLFPSENYASQQSMPTNRQRRRRNQQNALFTFDIFYPGSLDYLNDYFDEYDSGEDEIDDEYSETDDEESEEANINASEAEDSLTKKDRTRSRTISQLNHISSAKSKKKKPNIILSTLMMFMDPSILKDKAFLCICVANFLIFSVISANIIFVNNLIEHVNGKDSTSAVIISFAGIFGNVGRLATTLIDMFRRMKYLPYMMFMLLISSISMLVIPWMSNIVTATVCISTYWFCMGVFSPMMNCLLAEVFGLQKLTNCVGVLMVIRGTGNLIGPPVIALLSQNFGSITPFVIVGSVVAFGDLWMMIAYFILRKRQKASSFGLSNMMGQVVQHTQGFTDAWVPGKKVTIDFGLSAW